MKVEESDMQGIILAVGMGKRLGKYARGNTQYMVGVNGRYLEDLGTQSIHGLTSVGFKK